MTFLEVIKRTLIYCREYNFECFIYRTFASLLSARDNTYHFSKVIYEKKHEAIIKYLKRYYQKCYLNKDIVEANEYRKCIWTAWFQGEENAPQVIQMTIASIRKNANGHRVIVLTKKNLDNYISIPLVIKEKNDRGIIGNAHYSDIVRMKILSTYGGVWLDATMLLSKPIEEKAFTTPFYSFGFKKTHSIFVSNNRWIVRVIGGEENSEYLARISQMLIDYWSTHNICIDYFVFDYLIEVLYQQNNTFKKLIDFLPRKEHFTSEFRKIINFAYVKNEMQYWIDSNQPYYLSYRYPYKLLTEEGHMTYYGYLYNLYLESDNDKKE